MCNKIFMYFVLYFVGFNFSAMAQADPALVEKFRTMVQGARLDLTYKFSNSEDIKAIAELLESGNLIQELRLNNFHTRWLEPKPAIADEEARVLARALTNNNSLRILNLGGNKIGDGGAHALAQALRTNNSLQSLIIGCNDLTSGGSIALLEALKINTSLRHLNLRASKIGTEAAQVIGDMLKTNKSLTSLDISANKIDENNLPLITESLTENTSLKTLSIAENELYSNGAKEIAKALKNNRHLEKLDLDYCYLDYGYKTAINITFDYEGIIELFNALEKHATIKDLILSRNNLFPLFNPSKEQVGRALGEALVKNKSLRSLNLSFNRGAPEIFVQRLAEHSSLEILDLGYFFKAEEYSISVSFFNKLKESTNLKKLILTNSGLGDYEFKKLKKALTNNTTITQLGISDNKIDKHGVKHITEMLKENNNIKYLDMGTNDLKRETAELFNSQISLYLQRNKECALRRLNIPNSLVLHIIKDSTVSYLNSLHKTTLPTYEDFIDYFTKGNETFRYLLSVSILADEAMSAYFSEMFPDFVLPPNR